LRKYIPLVAFSLFICLFIYLFFRTEKTIINQVFISLFSKEAYHNLKTSIHTILPLYQPFIYSLPEGLWVFCITITSRFFYMRIGRIKINLSLVPLVVAVGLELCQLLHVTNGRFDFMDIGFSFFFWLVAYTFTDTGGKEENIRTRTTFNGVSCAFCYSIVYLAHVIR
jgi:hypothetical protein